MAAAAGMVMASSTLGSVLIMILRGLTQQIRLLNLIPARVGSATFTSSGPVTVLATGQTTVNNYWELWAFAKENSQWKIARYSFNQP